MEDFNDDLLMESENSVLIEFANRLNITPMQLIEENKKMEICDIRHLYCKLRHDEHRISYSATGREINRTPATVKYGVTRINVLIGLKDKKIVGMWNRVKDISDLHKVETPY